MNPKFKLYLSPTPLTEQHIQVSAESNQDRESVETELMFFARSKKIDDLGDAVSVELQDQIEAEFANGTRCRCRSTKPPGTGPKKFTQTIKIPRKTDHGVKSVMEHTVEIDEEFFEAFRTASHRCVKKVRARYATQKVELKVGGRIVEGPQLFFEVDIFKDKEGKPYELIKIDLELDALIAFAEREFPGGTLSFDVDLTKIPLELYDVFDGKDASRKADIDQLWADVVLNPQNPEV